MDFDEAKEIVKKNVGARMTRNKSGIFYVTLQDGTLYDDDTVSVLNPTIEQEKNLTLKLESELQYMKSELEKEKTFLKNQENLCRSLRSEKNEMAILIEKNMGHINNLESEINNLNCIISHIPEPIWINAEKEENKRIKRDKFRKEISSQLLILPLKEIKKLKDIAIDLDCPLTDVRLIDEKIKNKQNQGNSYINSPSKNGVFCEQCGGDGGATGNCPRCGGNGIDPEFRSS